jgi:hypothetical protein
MPVARVDSNPHYGRRVELAQRERQFAWLCGRGPTVGDRHGVSVSPGIGQAEPGRSGWGRRVRERVVCGEAVSRSYRHRHCHRWPRGGYCHSLDNGDSNWRE